MLPSTVLDWLYTKVQELGRHKLWFLSLGFLFVIVTLINGVGVVPEAPYQRLSENLFITRTDIHFRNNFQETLLLPAIAFILNLTSPLTFNILCYVIIVCGYAVFVVYTYLRWGALQALIFSALLITSPLTTVLFTWLGMPDGLSVALTIPFLFTNSALLIFALAVLGSTNHLVFLIAAGEIIALRWFSRDGIKIQHVMAMGAGGIAGTLLVKAFLAFNQITVAPRAEFLFTRSVWEWTKLNITHLPLSLFSLFNIHWLAIIICFLMFFKWDKRFYLSVSVIFAVNYGVSFFSLDTTRIFSLLSLGIFMLCLFHSYTLAVNHPEAISEHQRQFLQALILIGVVSIFSPRYFSWAGEIHATPFYEFIIRLLIR
ncbi:MAG: hypothetical protein L6Q26_05190 [Anaerolineales bacterium]|nr:hypothetical protein [Anaerolineales bacterium]NUQ84251.1 hypothetical protein [Anaerolineales bacterium]